MKATPIARYTLVAPFFLVVALPLTGQQTSGQPVGWTFRGEVTSVMSDGNSESFTLGFDASVRRRWTRDEFRLEGGAVRTESARITRRAVGTSEDFSVETTSDTEKTAESFYARTRYDRTVSGGAFGFGGIDWMRNTFAGIDSRFLIAAGGGNRWVDGEKTRFQTDLSATYTLQSDVVENPFVDQNFPGLRAGWQLERAVSSSATIESRLAADLNLSDTDDARFDLTNSISVSINDFLALKPSLQFLWRNQPSLARVPLFAPDGSETGTTVSTSLAKLDTFFRVALAITP